MCGEQFGRHIPASRQRGSPPRVRGTGICKIFCTHGLRITPACAGNSDTLPISPIVPRDHPRVCGEQQNQITLVDIFRGSPPRVRGTVPIGMQVVYIFRITPACAGNRKGRQHLHSPESDHPRVCGEQVLIPEFILKLIGSPPRVRGTVHNLQTGTFIKGITPACAGNREFVQLVVSIYTDHPRVCGEQLSTASASSRLTGSPPRVRGTAIQAINARRGVGITPACAGNSQTIHLLQIR